MLRTTLRRALPLTLIALTTGCSLFAPRPAPLARTHHVMIVGIDGIRPADITPKRTPHLSRMRQDGAHASQLVARRPHSRLATYAEALALYDTTILERCRAYGLRASALLRSRELKTLDARPTILPEDVSVTLDNPVSVGAYAATRWLAQRPALMFIELSAGKDKPEDCDAGLGRLFAAVERAGLAGQTTMIVMSATAPNRYWMIRGPGIRHGHEIASRLTPGSTAAAAAHLLLQQGRAVSGHFPTAAFRTYSREPKSDGERIVPRGSIRGQTRSPSGRIMPHASVLLVKNEPVDGIFERWSDADEHGEFRFDSIPAGQYDYVFVFDNLPSRLRRSLLVARNLKVKRDTTTTPVLGYQRMQGSDKNAPPVPAARKSAAFLTDGQVERLRRTAYRNDAIPMLAADALSGRRVRTGLIRRWLIASAARLHRTLEKDAITPGLVVEMTDLAAAYDVNRASGLLTNTEDRDVRSALKLAAVHLVLAQDLKKMRPDSRSGLALAITAGVLRSRDLSKMWLKKSDEILAARLESMAVRADENPGSVEHAELCSMLAAAMTNRSLGSDNYPKRKLRRVTKLATAYLTPVDRPVASTDRASTPKRTLGFLGLAKSAFADRPLGGRARVIWKGCGSPVWAPRGSESIVGSLLTEAGSPKRSPLRPIPSTKLTDTTAILTHAWGTPGEWLVRVSGWTVDVHARGTGLLTLTTTPVDGVAESRPRVVRFRTSPAYDYVLLAGQVSHKTKSHLTAYRHILFNKLTGYVVVTDELPAGMVSATRPQRFPARKDEADVPFQLMMSAAQIAGRTGQGDGLRLVSTSSRPSFVIYARPAGSKALATFGVWDATLNAFSDDDDESDETFGGAHLTLTTPRGREFIRIARMPALVADNTEDNVLQGAVGIIRRGPKSADLIRADWAQMDDVFFRLDNGHGYVTVRETGEADGWSRGRSSRPVAVGLGESAPASPKLTVDGKPKGTRQEDGRETFDLPSGPHPFRLK